MNAILAMASLVTAAPRTPSPDPYPRRRRQAAVRRHRWPPQHRGHYRACTRDQLHVQVRLHVRPSRFAGRSTTNFLLPIAPWN